jgi:hypothetical protein
MSSDNCEPRLRALRSIPPCWSEGPPRSVTAELHGSARAHWWRSFAPQRVFFLPRLSVWAEEDEGKKGLGLFRIKAPCRRSGSGRGRRRCGDGEIQVRPSLESPLGSSAVCARCKRPIQPGERAFHYPQDRSLLLRRRRLRRGGEPGVRRTGVRRRSQHLDVTPSGRGVRQFASSCASTRFSRAFPCTTCGPPICRARVAPVQGDR